MLRVIGARLGGDANLSAEERCAKLRSKERRPCLPHGETLATALVVPSLAECRRP
jgi:hypothetical protein